MDPIITASLTATKALWAAYAGYQKGKLGESDQALREEVRRRSEMIRNHLDAIHDEAHRDGKRRLRRSINDVMQACDVLITDARYAVSHTPNSKHDAAPQMNKKALKKLIEHDLATLERLRDSTQAANQLAHDLAGGSEESELVDLAGTVRQKMTGARNHFSERNMIIDGLTKR
jgi:Asp-tRNA(Asn)/Glu-tRNA(Gln) amidotransferase A subunit family amidase